MAIKSEPNSFKFGEIFVSFTGALTLFLTPICLNAQNLSSAANAANAANTTSQNTISALRPNGLNDAQRAALAAAVDSPIRIDKARDAHRHPAQTLEFFGVLPSDTVIEIWPGQGWYSSILGPYLKSGNGHYIGAHFDTSTTSSNLVKQIVDSFKTRFGTKPEEFGDLSIVSFGPRSRALGPENSVDAVLTFRNIHNWMAQGWAEKAFDDFFKVLKPGGILGIEEHRGDDNSPQDPLAEDGYVREDYVIDMALEAGFELVGRSQINANPRDTKDHPFGVWTLPPVGRTSMPGQIENLGFDTSRYIAIGESDRMTLLFRKPLAPPAPVRPTTTIAGIKVPFPIRVIGAPKSPPATEAANARTPNPIAPSVANNETITSASLPPISPPPAPPPAISPPPQPMLPSSKPTNANAKPNITIPAWNPLRPNTTNKSEPIITTPKIVENQTPNGKEAVSQPIIKPDEPKKPEIAPVNAPVNMPVIETNNPAPTSPEETNKPQITANPEPIKANAPTTNSNNVKRPSPPPPGTRSASRPNSPPSSANRSNATRPSTTSSQPSTNRATRTTPTTTRPTPRAAPRATPSASAPKAKSSPTRQTSPSRTTTNRTTSPTTRAPAQRAPTPAPKTKTAPKAKAKTDNVPSWNPRPKR